MRAMALDPGYFRAHYDLAALLREGNAAPTAPP